MDINKEIQKVAELNQMAEEFLDKAGLLKDFDNKETIIFDKKITTFGSSSGHVTIPGQFVGHDATILIKKRQKDDEK